MDINILEFEFFVMPWQFAFHKDSLHLHSSHYL